MTRHPLPQDLTPAASEICHWMFESSADCVKLLTPDGRMLAMNEQGCRLMQVDHFDSLCHCAWSSLWPLEARPLVESALAQARLGQVGHFAAYCPTAKGEPRWWDVRVTPMRGPGGRVDKILSVSRDITEHKRTEALAQGQKRAFELAMSGAPLSRILEVLARSLEAQSGGTMLASILLLDADESRLRHGAAPTLPPSYNQAIDGLEIGPAAGSCGTAAFREEPVCVRDIENDFRWRDFREVALSHGLRACWSHPILSSQGQVLGTLAAYFREVREPRAAELEALMLLVNTAGLILQRHREAEERQASEAALRASEARLRTLVSATSSILWTTSAMGEIVVDQPGWRAFTGQSFEEMRGLGWLSALHVDDREATCAVWSHSVESLVPYQHEQRVRRADGTYRHMSVRAVPIFAAGGQVTEWVGVHTDITERKESERHLHELAKHDMLTRLPNRAYLNERLHSMLHGAVAGDSCAVLLIDLDRFKQVNDSMGHEAGDVLLQEVARRFEAVIGAGDFVSRLGGDEFVVVLRHVPSREAVQAMAEQLITTLTAPIFLGRQQVIVGASVGAALYPDHGRTKEELFQHADLAMYRAKAAGRNCFRFFLEEMGVRAKQRMDLEMALRRALAQEQFELHYQPRIDLGTGRAVGMEALLRWRHPERGWVPPLEFIPIAEETGLIEAIGGWVLARACSDTAALRERLGRPLQVSVNLSARQLQSPGLAARVRQALDGSGLPAEQLELELTESAFIEDMEASAQTLKALKGLGVALSVDDFGTGYSSLAYLRRFPVDTVKLDRSFVVQTTEGTSRQQFIKAVRDLAHALNMKVVAEGVEDVETLELLQAIGCDEAQGYLFAKPLPLPELAACLQSLL